MGEWKCVTRGDMYCRHPEDCDAEGGDNQKGLWHTSTTDRSVKALQRQLAELREVYLTQGQETAKMAKYYMEQLAERDAEVAALRTALGSLRDYVSDVSEGHLAYAEARPSIRKMAAEDLARIDALTKEKTDAK